MDKRALYRVRVAPLVEHTLTFYPAWIDVIVLQGKFLMLGYEFSRARDCFAQAIALHHGFSSKKILVNSTKYNLSKCYEMHIESSQGYTSLKRKSFGEAYLEILKNNIACAETDSTKTARIIYDLHNKRQKAWHEDAKTSYQQIRRYNQLTQAINKEFEQFGLPECKEPLLSYLPSLLRLSIFCISKNEINTENLSVDIRSKIDELRDPFLPS